MSASLTETRAGWLGLLARSAPTRLAELMPGDLPDHRFLRAPEVGAIMVQGRTGGTGAPFNLGEMTVTRCALTLPCGTVGHGHVAGRDKAHATRVALIDAMLQTDRAPALRQAILHPLATEEAARAKARAEKAAATKVDFFTMVRGEDA